MLALVMAANRKKRTRSSGASEAAEQPAPHGLAAAVEELARVMESCSLPHRHGRFVETPVKAGRILEALDAITRDPLFEACIGFEHYSRETGVAGVSMSGTRTIIKDQQLCIAHGREISAALENLTYVVLALQATASEVQDRRKAFSVIYSDVLGRLHAARVAFAAMSPAEKPPPGAQRARPHRPGWIVLMDAAAKYGVKYSTLQDWTKDLLAIDHEKTDGLHWLRERAVVDLLKRHRRI